MKLALTLGLFCFGVVSGYGQESVRIAVVDMTALFEAHPGKVAAEARVTQARDAARKVFRDKSNELKKVLQEHQGLVGSGQSEAGREALERARVIERELAAMKTTQERDLEEAFLKEKRAILESIEAAVRTFNEEAGYALILDRSAAAANGIPMVIDVNGLDDITEAVKRLLGG
ncbi:MAG: OmpH family outer membrane protein [Verrucomicrobiota bacterium]